MASSVLVSAFVVPSVEFPPTLSAPRSTVPTEEKDAVTTAAPWRVALNFGRESSTPLWEGYGRSGIRFPVVVPCEFLTHRNSVLPQSDTVSYVADAVVGGVHKPVVGGDWKLSSTSDNDHKKKLEFTLNFPEEVAKQDVKIPGSSTLVLEGSLYPQDELKRVEEAFSAARQEEWKALEQIDELERIRKAPKKWNHETQRWEQPTIDEPLTSLFSKQFNAFVKGQERRRRFRDKPQSGVEMSDRPGWFPGFAVNNLVYFGRQGIIRNQSQGGMVVGTWSAEPIVR